MKETAFLGARYFMGSVTNVSNRPFRRLVSEYGADATLGEMAIAKYVANGGKQDLTLIRRDPHEKIFGAQIVGGNPNHLIKAAKLAEKFGADFVDFNCACPHQSVVSHGGGAILLKRPGTIGELVKAIAESVSIPVSLKIRKGFDADEDVAEEVAEIAQKSGVRAIFIHGRTKAAQYRGNCDWALIERIAHNSDVPVIGCGDLAHGSDVLARAPESACSGFAIARGALLKPWIFKEIVTQTVMDPNAEERLSMLKRLVSYTLEAYGTSERSLARSRTFLFKQLEFLVRYVPTGAIGRELPMQERSDAWTPRDTLEELWSHTDKESMATLLKMAGFPETADGTESNESSYHP